MRVDAEALRSFAELGQKMFWLRQVMFVGATVITTLYLSSYVPVFCYLACAGAELAEGYLNRQILAAKTFTEETIDRLVTAHTLVAGWSAAAVSTYGVIVAQLGEEQFLFVPLIYMFAAALYGTMFNHQIVRVLMTRMIIYVAGFLVLTGAEIVVATRDNEFLAFAQFFTVVSASFFFVINAIEFRRNYCERRVRERDAKLREERYRQEVDERRSAEVARETSEVRFKSLFENAPIPIREEDLSGMKRLIDERNISDPDEFSTYLDTHPEFLEACAREIVVVDANRASLEQHGYADKSEMLSRVVRKLSPGAKKVVPMTLKAIHAGESGRSYETEITRIDGEVRTVAATWSVVPGHEDTYGRILLCSIDLTDRLLSEAALRQAQKMQAVGQLTGGVAHDFNNLLTVISGNMDLLEETVEVDPELSDPIRRAVHRGAELTQRLLAFSRKQPLSARSINLRELIGGMTNILGRSLGEEIVFDTDIPEKLWLAWADPGQVEAALLNLALNSRDAMPNGGTLLISCRNTSFVADNDRDVEAGDYVALSVSDTGFGMAPRIASQAYEPFFTTKEVGKGSGLGLSMVYGFAKQSHGGFQIESAPGKGTTVSLFLPRATVPQVAAAPRSSEIVVEGRGETILVLEDDSHVRSYLAKLMHSFGYRVLEARDAMAAREVLGRGEKIDLLISDVMLPGGIRGPEFAKEMLHYFPKTPVIFISGRPTEVDTENIQSLGDVAFISKPFTKEEISEEILHALRKH